MSIPADSRVQRRDALGGIQQKQRQVRPLQVLARHDDAQLFGVQISLRLSPDAGRIDQQKTVLSHAELRINGIPRGSRNGRNDGTLLAKQPVQQRRLADVRTADQSNFG